MEETALKSRDRITLTKAVVPGWPCDFNFVMLALHESGRRWDKRKSKHPENV